MAKLSKELVHQYGGRIYAIGVQNLIKSAISKGMALSIFGFDNAVGI